MSFHVGLFYQWIIKGHDLPFGRVRWNACCAVPSQHQSVAQWLVSGGVSCLRAERPGAPKETHRKTYETNIKNDIECIETQQFERWIMPTSCLFSKFQSRKLNMAKIYMIHLNNFRWTVWTKQTEQMELMWSTARTFGRGKRSIALRCWVCVTLDTVVFWGGRQGRQSHKKKCYIVWKMDVLSTRMSEGLAKKIWNAMAGWATSN